MSDDPASDMNLVLAQRRHNSVLVVILPWSETAVFGEDDHCQRRSGHARRAGRDALAHPAAQIERPWPADQSRWAPVAPDETGHAHDGRLGLRSRVADRLPGWTCGHRRATDHLRCAGATAHHGPRSVGFADDCIKIFRQTSLGLRSRTKLGGQIAIAAVFAWQVLEHPDYLDLTPADQRPSFLRDFGPVLGLVSFCYLGDHHGRGHLQRGEPGRWAGWAGGGATVPARSADVLIGLWEARNDINWRRLPGVADLCGP